MRILNEPEAHAIYSVLVNLAGASENNRDDFVRNVLPDQSRTWYKNGVDEYRFQGDLGFGGKFRNNGNRNNIPYIDYYSEHKTPEREEIVQEVNHVLKVILS